MVRPCAIPPRSQSTRCLFCQRGGCGHFYDEYHAHCHARCFLMDLFNNPLGQAATAFEHGQNVSLDTSRDELPHDQPLERHHPVRVARQRH
jgi:hypothetical protein